MDLPLSERTWRNAVTRYVKKKQGNVMNGMTRTKRPHSMSCFSSNGTVGVGSSAACGLCCGSSPVVCRRDRFDGSASGAGVTFSQTFTTAFMKSRRSTDWFFDAT